MKETIIKAVTAVICVIALCITSSVAVGKYSDAVKESAKITAEATPAQGFAGNNGGSNDADVPTDAPTADDPSTDAPSTDDPTADAPSTDAPTADAPSTDSTAANVDPLSTKEGIVAYYNKAVKATKPAPKGQQTMTLRDGSLTGDGAIGAVLKVLEPAAVKALAKNSKETDWIPGSSNDLLVSDVESATASTKNGVVTINIKLKDQVDGSDGDSKNGGPVARGIGTLGSIDGALADLGAEFTSGRETVKLTYTDASINVQINEKTGKIEHGTWKHTVNIFIGEAKAKLSVVSATLKNFKGIVDYKVVI